MDRVKDKTAIITGAASGLGEGCALLLAKEGATIVVADINESKGQEAIAKSIIELLYQGEIFYGRGSGKDIVDATKEAIINGFDAIYRLKSIWPKI